MTRVLLASEFFHPHRGGIETHVQELARQLRRSEVPAEVVTFSPGPEVVEGIPVHRVGGPLLPGLDVPFTTDAVDPYLALLRSRGVELVHCHLSVLGVGVSAGAYLAQRAGIATVVTFHSLLNGYEKAFRILDRLTSWSRLPITFTAASEAVAEQVSGLVGRDVPVLPVIMDPDRWRPLPPRPGHDGTFRVVSTMRLNPRKRPRALVEVLRRVRSGLPPGLSLKAEIIGDGPGRASLRRAVDAAGLGREVTLRGGLSQPELREAYGRADAFVLPSIEESFGLAALEARASGLPVVVLAGTGPTAFIRHEVEGLVADSDEGLAGALVRLARDEGLRRRIAHHNRSVDPPLGREAAVRRHVEMYRRLVEERA